LLALGWVWEIQVSEKGEKRRKREIRNQSAEFHYLAA